MRTFVLKLLCLVGAAGCLIDNAEAGIYTSGHGDIGVIYENGELELHWNLSSEAVVDGSRLGTEDRFDPVDITAFVSDPSVARPAGMQWDPIGNAAGEDVWFLPQTGSTATAQGKPFLGLNAELPSAEWSGLQWQITGVNGPGEFSMWQIVTTSPTFRVSSVDGLPDTFTAGHDHFNYGFTAPGLYEVDFAYSGTHVTDGFHSDNETFRFLVSVPEPGSLAVVFVLGAFGCVTRRRRNA